MPAGRTEHDRAVELQMTAFARIEERLQHVPATIQTETASATDTVRSAVKRLAPVLVAGPIISSMRRRWTPRSAF